MYFIADSDSRVITDLGLRKADPEPIEEGVGHPATYLIDRRGRIRFADVRTDYQVWLDPRTLVDALERID